MLELVPRALRSWTFLTYKRHPRRSYLANNLAASSAIVSERNTQMSPLGVRTTRPQPLVSISLSLPDILILIRYIFPFLLSSESRPWPICSCRAAPPSPRAACPHGDRPTGSGWRSLLQRTGSAGSWTLEHYAGRMFWFTRKKLVGSY